MHPFGDMWPPFQCVRPGCEHVGSSCIDEIQDCRRCAMEPYCCRECRRADAHAHRDAGECVLDRNRGCCNSECPGAQPPFSCEFLGFTCSTCHMAVYCSRACQVAAWPVHRETCGPSKCQKLHPHEHEEQLGAHASWVVHASRVRPALEASAYLGWRIAGRGILLVSMPSDLTMTEYAAMCRREMWRFQHASTRATGRSVFLRSSTYLPVANATALQSSVIAGMVRTYKPDRECIVVVCMSRQGNAMALVSPFRMRLARLRPDANGSVRDGMRALACEPALRVYMPMLTTMADRCAHAVAIGEAIAWTVCAPAPPDNCTPSASPVHHITAQVVAALEPYIMSNRTVRVTFWCAPRFAWHVMCRGSGTLPVDDRPYDRVQLHV